MWELIRQNKRKSLILFILMGLCLVILGYLIGAVWMPPDGGIVGMSLALIIWMILSLVSYFRGDSILLSMSGARKVTPDVHPQLFNVVEEMKIAASLPVMPRVYIIDEAAPNAFATGRSPEKSAIAVTAGLLARLNRDELQGVVAHEMSHIVNRDILFMTFAGIMLGSIVLLSQVFVRGSIYSGMGSRRYRSRSSSKGGGQGQAALAIIAIVFAILAPILAHILYYAISRRREYLADASAVRLTRYPEGLASALEKISTSKEVMPRVNKVTAPMYIANPLRKKGIKASGLSSTHPPIAERIKILRAMSHSTGLLQYQKAFNKITGDKSGIIPQSGLKESADIPIRAAATSTAAADSPTTKKGIKNEKRELGDLIRAVNQYLFVVCVCGLKIKIPPDFKKKSFPCPRCGKEVKIPAVEMATAAAVLEGLQAGKKAKAKTKSSQPKAKYHRKGNGWESFSCSCGQRLQLSPGFHGNHLQCSRCGQRIEITTE